MEVIRLTSKDLENLTILNKDGYESKIYLYNDNDKIVVLKIFKKQDLQVIQNKIDKMILLKQLNLDELTNMQKIVMVDGICCGYSMEYQKDFYSLLDLIGKRQRQTKIFYLKRLKEITLKLHKHNIIIGDFNPQNFLIKNGQMKLCDNDNWQVQDKPQDIKNACQKHYLSYNLPIDNCLDAYLFNILTIAVFKNIYCIYIPNYIQSYRAFHEKEAEATAKKMIYLNNGYEEEYIIDKLKVKEKRHDFNSNKHLWI